MAYQATGRVHRIFATEEKSASFSVRDLVLEISDGKFPQMIKFQLVQDKCALLDDYSEGDEVTVEFDLRGREWNDKYFTNLNVWRMGKADGQGDSPPPPADEPPMHPSPEDFDDEIPF